MIVCVRMCVCMYLYVHVYNFMCMCMCMCMCVVIEREREIDHIFPYAFALSRENSFLTRFLARFNRVSSVNTGNELSRDRIKRLKAERDWRVPTVFGCSLVLGAYVMAIAREKGCKTAELLAIKVGITFYTINGYVFVLCSLRSRLGLLLMPLIATYLYCAPCDQGWDYFLCH